MGRKKTEKLYGTFTKEQIREKLASDRSWIERALIVLLSLQTQEEQNVETTIEDNKIGFNGYDAKYLTYCAKWVSKNGNHLNDSNLKKCGERLPKYWKQIAIAITKKNS